MERKGNTSGDINFVSAAMSVGMPLDGKQVLAVKRDNGRDYVQWYLGDVSTDGTLNLSQVNHAWSNPKQAKDKPHLQGMVWVMEFLQAKPKGCRGSRDLLTFAHDHLRDCGEPSAFAWPRDLRDAGAFVDNHPADRAGHVFAFLLNRDICIYLAKLAMEDPSLMFSRGPNTAGLMRENAPKWRKDQFLKAIG